MYKSTLFTQLCCYIVGELIPNHISITTFGQQFYVKPDDRTMVTDEFFIRFTTGSTVVLGWDYARNVLIIAVSTDGGNKLSDEAFIYYKNPMPVDFNRGFVAYYKNPMPVDSNRGFVALMTKSPISQWPEGTWCSELRDSIVMILNYAEADKLDELFSKNGTDSDGVKYVDVSPNVEPEKISKVDYYKKLREFKF